jgi:hypothetical protein
VCAGPAEPPVTAHTDRGEEVFCAGCWDAGSAGAVLHDHTGLEGYDPCTVELADLMLDFSGVLLAEAAERRGWSTTREEWVAIQQLESAANSVYSAQCWLLRAERDGAGRRSRPVVPGA